MHALPQLGTDDSYLSPYSITWIFNFVAIMMVHDRYLICRPRAVSSRQTKLRLIENKEKEKNDGEVKKKWSRVIQYPSLLNPFDQRCIYGHGTAGYD